MKHRFIYIVLFVITGIGCNRAPKDLSNAQPIDSLPSLFPDYIGVTVPATIAPLDCAPFPEAASLPKSIYIQVAGTHGNALLVTSRRSQWHGHRYFHFPKKAWESLLTANTGDSLTVTVFVQRHGVLYHYKPFPIYVSEAPIDYGLAYRLIAPCYEIYSRMGIYERDLSSYTQTPVFENTLMKETCVNCHAVNRGDPASFSMHLRGAHGGTVLRQSSLEVINPRTPESISNCVYPYWHPSGRYIAYSNNTTQQLFPMHAQRRVEVYDTESDVVVYDTQTHTLLRHEALCTADFETFPAFSPDGKFLYFCVAAQQEMPRQYKEVRYNLCRLAFDPGTGTFSGPTDTLLKASAFGKSLTFPRPSYDGRYVLFTLADYGTFPIWHAEADLGLLDVATGTWRLLDEVNSADVDSYHSWSSNSRWFVFASRRMDGLYTRPYLCALDAQGQPGKPFLLPQKDPQAYYARGMFSFNIPEFITAPIQLDAREVVHKALTRPQPNT